MKNKIGYLLVALLLASDAQVLAGAEWSDESETPSSTLEFSVLGMNCEMCPSAATEALGKIPGVLEAHVDFDSSLGRVQTDGQVTREDIRRGLGTFGFEALFPGEARPEPLPEEVKARLDIRTASHGEAIRIKDHLAPGKLTIFDYFADWCGPCHLLSAKLERLVLRYENVALRKVDLVKWDSEAARQATRQFKMPGLPYTRIYDDRGKLLGQVHGNAIEEIEALIRPHARLRQQ